MEHFLTTLLLLLLTGFRPVKGRECEKIRVTSETPLDEAEFFALPETDDGRIPVPFTFSPLEDAAVLSVNFFGGEFFDEADEFYSVSVNKRNVAILKTISGQTSVLEKSKANLASMRSFYARLKVRQDYTQIGLYEAGADGGEPLITFKDEKSDKSIWTHYTFSVSKGHVDIAHRCTASLGQDCIHALECMPEVGVLCSPTDATCDCDEDHVRFEDTCVANPAQVGDSCVDSRQCAKLEARCRPTIKGDDASKKCVCPHEYYINSYGVCTEPRDNGELDFDRLNREPTWREKSPGRVTLPPSEASLTSHCGISLNIKGAKDSPRQFFPLRMNRSGFDLGFFIRPRLGSAQNVLVVQLIREPEGRIYLTLVIEEDKKLSVEFADEAKTAESFTNLFREKKEKSPEAAFSLSMRCDASCVLTVAKNGQELKRVKMAANPWTTFDSWLWAPTHATFEAGSRSTDLRLRSHCVAGVDERCANTRDCAEVDINLVCGSRGVCELITI